MAPQLCVPSALFPHGPPLFGIRGWDVIEHFEYDDEDGYAAGMTIMSLYFMAAWLFVCAVWSWQPRLLGLFTTEAEVPKQRSSLSWVVCMYQAITAVFFLALQTQLNKMVVTMAAVHNWCEWLILGNIYIGLLQSFPKIGQGKQGIKNWNLIVTCGITFQILGVLMIDDVLKSFAFEECLGLWPDIQLFGISLFCYWKFRGTEGRKQVFGKFVLAAGFHLVLIMLFLIGGFGLMQKWPTGQSLQFVTSFFNSMFYSMFVNAFDSWQKQMEARDQTDLSEPLEKGSYTPMSSDAQEHADKVPGLTFSPAAPAGSSSVSTGKITCLMTACLFLSFSLVLLPPLVLGKCVIPAEQLNGAFFGWTTIHVDQLTQEDKEKLALRLAEQVAEKRENPGNVMSKAFMSLQSDGDLQFFTLDKWTGEESAKDFTSGRGNQLLSLGMTKEVVMRTLTWHQLESDPVFPVPDVDAAACDSSNVTSYSLSTAVTGYTRLTVKDKYLEASRIKVAALTDETRAKAGNNFYFALVGDSNATSNEFLFVEQWADTSALRSHLYSSGPIRLFGFAALATESKDRKIGTGFQEIIPACP